LQVFVSILGLVLVKEPFFNEAGYEARVGSADSTVPSAFYSERTYFSSRDFILQVLAQCVPALRRGAAVSPLDGLDDVMKWLYVSNADGAPKLLEQAVRAAKEMVADAEKGVTPMKGPLLSISKGAVVMLKRKLQELEEASSVVAVERGPKGP
jgi:ubiquitin-conjugating enzyme E2 O